jgi:cystathionine beta-lyase
LRTAVDEVREQFEELLRIGEICNRHGCLVVSDEIHCDFVLPGHKHYIYASLSEEIAQNSIICLTPTKSFNIAGLQVGNLIIPNRDVKHKMRAELAKTGYSQLNTVTLAAGQAAYETGGEWFDAVWKYIIGNLGYVRDFMSDNLPGIKLIEPEGTYLLWIDFRKLGYWAKELELFLADEAKILLTGAPGAEGFLRVNIACPLSVLKKAFAQLERAVSKRKQ